MRNSARPTLTRRPSLKHGVAAWAAGTSIVSLIVAVAAIYAGAPIALGGIAIVIALISLALVPVEALPAVALATYALIPTNYLPGNNLFNSLSPGFIVISVWCVRRLFQVRRLNLNWMTTLSLAILLWYLVATVRGIDAQSSLVYDIAFFSLVFIPSLISSTGERKTRNYLVRTWAVVAIALGIYAVAEWIAQYNPLGSFYILTASTNLEQVWSVYRVTTTLGHPLANGYFFAASAAFMLGMMQQRLCPRILGSASFMLSVVGVVLSGSRIALVAIGIGILCVLLVQALNSRLSVRRRLIPPVCFAVVAATIYNLPLVQDRLNSTEAVQSEAIRGIGIELTNDVAGYYHWLGSGPGTSVQAAELVRPTSYILESSLYQVLISVGLPGAVMLIAAFASFILIALSRRQTASAATLLACLTCASSFPLIESYRPGLLLIGLAMYLASDFPNNPVHDNALDHLSTKPYANCHLPRTTFSPIVRTASK